MTPSFRQLLANPIQLLAFGLGSGLSPRAPGTAGTLVAALLWWWLSPMSLMLYLAVLAGLIAVGVWVSGRTANALGEHDHGGIVIDEWAGFWLTMTLIPAEWPWLVAGFALFRLFDVIKPWPISWLDRRIHGGWGIMIDDLVAGFFAWLVLFGARVLVGG